MAGQCIIVQMGTIIKSDDKLLYDYCSSYPVRHFKKDRPLFYQGEVPRAVYFIKSGVVKFYNITSQGEEKTVGYESDGVLIPLEWLFNRSPVALYYCDTFTDCQLYSLAKDDLINFLNSHPGAASSLMKRSISMYIGATIHLHALEQSRASDKLLYILHYLVLRFGERINKTDSKILLKITHQDIANLVGLTRETVSSELGKLAKKRIIKSKDPYYVVDTDKAQRELGENDFSNINL